MSEESSPPPGSFKRRVAAGLAVLYGASLLAAVAVLWRARSRENGSMPLAKVSGGLLSPLQGQGQDLVGMVSINGPIYDADSGGLIPRGAQAWQRRLQKLAEKKEVKAIVLSINSPGGSVGAVQELHDQIERLRREYKKPIVAHLGDVAASGGYYLAVACDKIVAHPGTLLGSIGVIFETANVQGLLSKIGVQANVIKSGKMKDIGSPTRAMTSEERALLQALINDAYGQFLQAVSEGRNIPEEQLRPLADGRIFSGHQALPLHLVDQLGDSHDAVVLAARLAGIKGQPKVLREGESFSSMLELIDSRLGLRAPQSAWLEPLRELTYSGLEYRWGR